MHKSSKKSIDVNCSIETLWKVLTEAEYTKQYMFNCAVESGWNVGDAITWKGNFEGYEAFQKGEILEISPNEKLKYSTFDPNFGLTDVPENYIHVSYELTPEQDSTVLTITNETFDGNEERMGHINQGWDMVIGKIKQVAEGLNA